MSAICASFLICLVDINKWSMRAVKKTIYPRKKAQLHLAVSDGVKQLIDVLWRHDVLFSGREGMGGR